MPELLDTSLWILAGIVLVSYTVQALSGFGSTIIAVTLGSHLYPIEFLLPVLVPLDLFLNAWLSVRHRRHIHSTVLVKQILPAMTLGLLAGVAVFHFLAGDALKTVFGLFVIALSARELSVRLKNTGGLQPISAVRFNGFTAAAGVIHGMYASGGPLLVYGVSRLNLSKAMFRATLTALWTLVNLILTVYYVLFGKADLDTLAYIALLFPVILLGLFLGEKLHARINEAAFGILIFVLLLGAGISIII